MQDASELRFKFIRQMAWVWAIAIILGLVAIGLVIIHHPAGAMATGAMALYILITGPTTILANMTINDTSRNLRVTGD